MRDKLPDSPFNRKDYIRPSKKWICGHTEKGCPCRIGPDHKGRCRADYECRPRLEIKEGEEKGRYYCIRPKSHGGPCEKGPLPDGTCCRAIPKCVPVRSLRAKRGYFSIHLALFTFIILLALAVSSQKYTWFSPGEISSKHSFSQVNKDHEGDSCLVCHTQAKGSVGDWIKAAWDVQMTTHSFGKLLSPEALQSPSTEKACLSCHEGSFLHQASVGETPTCWECHEDHQGVEGTLASSDVQCIACHGNKRLMEEAGQKAMSLKDEDYLYRSREQKSLSFARRPKGYTQVINAFGIDHPPFQIEEKPQLSHSNLKFDHALHLDKHFVKENGEALTCIHCHDEKEILTNFPEVSYKEHCQECHKLQFHLGEDSLEIPHEEAQLVRAFIHTLPEQFEIYAIENKKLKNADRIREFVDEKMEEVREQYHHAVDIQGQIFLGENIARTSSLRDKDKPAKAPFDGCILCHNLSSNDAETLDIEPVSVTKVWMPLASFNHKEHSMMACQECHLVQDIPGALQISLPGIANCTDCHHPNKKDPSTCITCHKFHHTPPLPTKMKEGA